MQSIKNPYLAEILACPDCNSNLESTKDKLTCTACGSSFPLQSGVPIFTPIPETIQPWERIERSSRQGTPWRQENWRWLEELVQRAQKEALYLDVGCGHGDFSQIFSGRHYIGLDIVPYPEVDIACDLTQCVPFKKSSVDRVVMMNVLEHVYAAENLLTRLANLLKPDGEIWMAVPFMLKIHQAPYDFARYTPYALEKMAANAGLEIIQMDGFYDPVFQLQDALGTVWAHALPPKVDVRGIIARAAVFSIRVFSDVMKRVLPGSQRVNPLLTDNPAAMGYLVVFKKRLII